MATVQDIYDEIGRIENAKQGIADAIGEKGVAVPSDAKLEEYPAKVREIITGSPYAVEYIPQELSGEQQAQARENIAAGTYSKPGDGIPKSDLAVGVQTSLGKADAAYQKPGTGIPATDMAEAVQTSLGKANSAYQKPNTGIPETDLAQAVRTSLGKANSAVQPAALEPITELIPEQATAQNQLADKNFVNSSVATNTANYISDNGQPFQSLADLEAYSGPLTNNDYAFVVGTDAAGNTTYTRYKYNASTGEWAEEYVLNNSSFTAAQWAAISSGITALLVQKLTDLPTAVVTYVSQTLSDAEKEQARANIGAGTYSKPGTGIPSMDLADKFAGSPTAGGPANRAFGIPFGNVIAGSTATDIKATVDNFPAQLSNGLCVYLRNDVVASASGWTLNVNGTGAKPVYASNSDASRVTTTFSAASTYLFVYNENRVNGGCWDMYYGLNTNDNTIGYNLRINGTIAPVKNKTYRYRLLFTQMGGNFLIPANTSSSTNATAARAVNQDKIDPFGPIWYYATTSAVDANVSVSASNLWLQYTGITLGYSFNRTGAALTLTPKAPVFIKCEPQDDGSAIIDADTPFVQTLPSTDDGKIYIFLGYADSATAITLYYWHPIYYFKRGAIRIWTNQEQTISGQSSDRPTLGTNDAGTMFFDKQIGKPIWWDGTGWVDASGVTV